MSRPASRRVWNLQDVEPRHQDQPPFRLARNKMGPRLGLQKLGASYYEIPPGAKNWPLQ